MEDRFGTTPDNTRPKVLGCAACVHRHEGNRRDKFKGRTEEGIYFGIEYWLHRVYLYE